MRPAARIVATTLAGLGWVVGVPASSGAQTAPPLPAVVIEGRGHGHGVGMAQDGALSMGRAGATTDEILGHFYPGTSRGRSGGTVRVEVVADAGPATVLAFPGGGEVRDAPGGSVSAGFPVSVGAGGYVELSFDGATYRARPVALSTVEPAVGPSGIEITLLSAAAVTPTTPTTLAPSPSTLPSPPPAVAEATPPPAEQAPPPPPPVEPSSTSGLWAVPAEGSTVAVLARDRRYRGVVSAEPGPGGLRLVNEVDVENYLRGMGEVRDSSWPGASLRAQAIAARTYALRAVAGGGDLCDTERCQVYLGQTAEYGAMDRAVVDTRGQVVTAGGRLALTVYSANAGGVSATPEEGFGSDNRGYPYLVANPYVSADPQHWTVQVEPADLARRLGYQGELTEVRVSRSGPSGRALEVSLEGSAGTMPVDGLRFMSEWGLRSNLFTLRVARADPVPEPALPEALPDPVPDLELASPPPPVALPAPQPAAVRPRPLDDAPWEAVVVAVLALGLVRRRSAPAAVD